MAFPAPVALSSPPNFRGFKIKLFRVQTYKFQRSSKLFAIQQTSATCCLNVKMEQSKANNGKLQLEVLKEKLSDSIPNSIKRIPWKKAKETLLQQLLLHGKKVLKWLLVAVFALSSLSDVLYSIYANKELMIPLGLFVGCLVTNFLKETTEELFHDLKPENGLGWQFLSISCIFVLSKFISAYFGVQARAFLLHVANGGLMQVFWLWGNLTDERADGNRENLVEST